MCGFGRLRYASLFSQPPNSPGRSGLRVGLTGGLGSGKSTVAAMLAAHGAEIFSADELARSLMQPGQPVFTAIVDRFGPEVLRADGTLDRAALARLAFVGGRIEELNAIVHPATIALQEKLTSEALARERDAIVIVESALIFETRYGNADPHQRAANEELKSWRTRFDRLILVTAPEEEKIARFIARSGAPENDTAREALTSEARRRLAQMIPDAEKSPQCDYIVRNDGTLDQLRGHVDSVWRALRAVASEPAN